MTQPAPSQPKPRRSPPWQRVCAGLALALAWPALSQAAEPVGAAPARPASAAKKPAASASAARDVGEQLREAVQSKGGPANKRLTLVINGKEKKYITLPAPAPSVPAQAAAREAQASDGKPRAASSPAVASAPAHQAIPAVVDPLRSRQYIRARAAALSGHDASARAMQAPREADAHWAYEGMNGPQAWGKLRPEFQLCANGKRQSPIHIDESSTLQGPAEALQFNYQPSGGSVINNGHTIEVEVLGDNTLTVRGASYKLQQLHFHHPAEEQVNARGFAMAAHLVHRNAEDQLAVLAVLLEPGSANALINRVWTHLPLDTGDRVRVPAGLLDLGELLPKDQRYYQFMGSLTTPPCTEGVLWLVLKQPVTLSPQQIRLFSQLFPNNARPVQPLHGRAVRDAQ